MKELGISHFNYNSNTFTQGERIYKVTDLIKVAEKYDTFDLPLMGIDLGVHPWGEIDIKDFAYHMKRINEADMQYPIILDDTGYICDGWHRLVKAIMNNQNTIKAIRLTVMPEPI